MTYEFYKHTKLKNNGTVSRVIGDGGRGDYQSRSWNKDQIFIWGVKQIVSVWGWGSEVWKGGDQ